MSSFTYPIAMSAPFARSVAIATLMGTTMLAGPLTAARADTAPNAATQLAQAAAPQNQPAAGTTETTGETVEQRITNLHTSLQITPDEESKWNSVAQAMRDNAAAMQKLVAKTKAQAPETMTAVQDLKTYKRFAQAHVDGLKKLISAFETLYNSMPDPQKKVADEVFQRSRHQGAPSHN
ncbi:MAG: Spy/CpxP family protein refolding chaperone [Alphaproteobacteria bacterium]